VALPTLEQPYVRRLDKILPGRRSEVFRRFTPGKGLTGDTHQFDRYLRRGAAVIPSVFVVGRTLVPTNWQAELPICWHLFKSNKNEEELLAAPPRCTGQTGTGHRSDRCRREDPARD
jgi:hypothetical protein